MKMKNLLKSLTVFACTALVAMPFMAQEAQAAEVAYYSFSFSSPGETATSSGYFSVTGPTVSINGWQEGSSPDVTYFLRQLTFAGENNLQWVEMTGNYPQSGTWYSYPFYNVASGSGYDIMADDYGYSVSGAGNAYN